MRVTLTLLAILFTATLHAQTQKCPADETSSAPATLTGALEYHPGVYAWYGLRPAQPLCGKSAIQLVFSDSAAFRQTHRFVGCTVTASGNLFIPATGYYTADLAILDAHLTPAPSCKQGSPLPDYSAVPIPASLHRYKVTASYDPKTFIFSAQARDAATGKPLTPWQTYTTDDGNGARDLQRMYCADGFAVSSPTDTAGHPSLQANVDPDFPVAIDVAIPSDATVQLSFTCTRSTAAQNR